LASDICARRGGIGNLGGEEKGERIAFQGSLQGEVSEGFKRLPFFEVKVKFVRITAGQYMNCNEKQVAGKDRSE
jgi:hypothetical protein